MVAKSTLKEEQRTNLGNIFFLCNKWDQVKTMYKDDVRRNTRRKLSKILGHLEGWQVVELNLEQELQFSEWNANASDSFNVLLQGLENLISRTIQNRLEKKYRWLLNFVLNLDGVLETKKKAGLMSKDKLEIQIRDIENELMLAQDNLKRCSEVETMIDEKRKNLLQDLRAYLTKDSVKSKLLDWKSTSLELKELRNRFSELIKTRLQDVILDWVLEETGPLQLASATIRGKCKEIQDEIDLRLGAIRKHELGLNLLESLDEDDSLNQKEIKILIVLSLLYTIVASLFRVLKFFSGAIDWLISRSKALEEQVKEMAVQKLTNMTEKAMKELLKEENLETIIFASFTHPYRHWLTKFQTDTKQRLSSSLEVMKQLKMDLMKKRDKDIFLSPLHIKVENCCKRLKDLEK